MPTVGKCLLFWLKYPAEMERLYESEEPDFDGLPDPDRTMERVHKVGAAAFHEAGELLEACAASIEPCLTTVAVTKRIGRSAATTWSLRFRVEPLRGGGRGFETGVRLWPERRALAPWIWSFGGRRVEDELIRILGCGTRGSAIGMDPGCVLLGEVAIPRPERLDEPVEASPLMAEVRQAFAALTVGAVESIARITKDREG